MIKFRNIVLLTIPAVLAMGCRHTGDSGIAQFSPLPQTQLTPTSDRGPQRLYATTDATSHQAGTTASSTEDWELNKRIQSVLLADEKLAAGPGQVIIQVDKGVVTLGGSISTAIQARRLREAVSQVPGVIRVVDNMKVGRVVPGKADINKPPTL